MKDSPKIVVTGSFGYLGKYVTGELVKSGNRVKTLTGHPNRENPFGKMVEPAPFLFDHPGRLVRELAGVDTLYNTYWVRFDRGATTYGRAVANTQNLIRAAAEAGGRRFVHVSITNPSLDSPFPYFSGKAVLEKTLAESGLSCAIVRPTVLFGTEDILINNIAWLLRRLPVFGVFGKGDYRVQPVYVGDVAKLMVELAGRSDNVVVDAVGPETFAYTDLVRLVREAVGSRSRIVGIPPMAAWAVGVLARPVLADVLVTRQEVGGLMAGLLATEGRPACPTRFSEWIVENASGLGMGYSSELKRHFLAS